MLFFMVSSFYPSVEGNQENHIVDFGGFQWS